MDAGVCSTCQHALGEINLEGLLGLFARVRCNACGLVNVLVEGAVSTAAVASPKRGNETVSLDDNPLYAAPYAPPEEDPAVAAYEEPSEVSAPPEYEAEVPPFEAAEEPPAYEENIDYDQPVPMQGVIPEEEEVPEIPAESTRINIDASDEDEQ